MIKTYKANTNVSINVVLPSKKNLHISFTPLSNGSSLFTTDNEDIMRAIENITILESCSGYTVCRMKVKR